MAEGFTPINTQEEFDAAIQARLARERATIEGKYSDYNDLKAQIQTLTGEKTTLEQKIAGFDTEKAGLKKQIDDANKKVKDLEKDALRTNAAIEKGLPLELRSRLAGETKEEINADAEKLVKYLGSSNNQNLPGFSAGKDESGSGTDAEYLKMLKEMEKE
jgi:hypothetical protein